ncbi:MULTISPECIES: FAD binding domain-containing protein [Cupriavidus]|uniref:Xanthine dehydrogenase family protein subunit M n=1 Tax=Cupriavidus basilensis TaxID=68895 RepID=A0A643G1P5_9BURK|nr:MULTISPECIES: xanthine dehydrogenase family protein subunit M [Cupriavidus]KUE88036.1 carbon monoxide dehydrogenase [Cupriavidus necator]NOV23813.1 xanthine dehydrogenase family protein subunit M [Cupriavidus necator]QOT81860.1 xanthine dehydrogenase family protein subunit M [Cupriavidus basilensis]BDB30278.1 xanthine dehydrogenase family protein subunit M [Cupriavidus sp. P-10]
MKPTSFEYRRPGTLDDALRLLAQSGPDAKVIAGGQSLVPMMNFRMARPDVLIDINGVSELDYHRRDGDILRIGALMRHADLKDSALVQECCPLMSEAYHYVAHGTVRNRGTLCGNLCHADPASEMPAVMLSVGATMVVRGIGGERRIAAEDFFQGIYATALEPNEILVEVQIPVPASRRGYAFEEVSARQGDFAMTLVAALLDIRGGRIEEASVAYAGVSDRARRLPAVEQALTGQSPSTELFDRVAALASEGFDLIEDIHADRQYRHDLIRTLTARALARAAERAQGHA